MSSDFPAPRTRRENEHRVSETTDVMLVSVTRLVLVPRAVSCRWSVSVSRPSTMLCRAELAGKIEGETRLRSLPRHLTVAPDRVQ